MTRTWCYGLACSTFGLATTTTSYVVFLFTSLSRPVPNCVIRCSRYVHHAESAYALVSRRVVSALRFERKDPQMNRSVTGVPSKTSAARCVAAPIQMHVLTFLKQRCRKFILWRSSGCLLAVRSYSTFLRLMRLLQLEGIVDD